MDLSERQKLELEQSSPLAWAWLNDLLTENQKPLEFTNHRFLIDPFEDLSEDLVVMKSAQVGFSVTAIIKSAWLCKYRKVNIGYVLPSQNIVKDFVAPKVDPLITGNKVINDSVSRDSITLKQIGDRFLYFRGAYSEREAIAISLDVLVLDELDRMPDPQVINTYDSRLQASEYGWRWRFSNPSAVGFGVDELYKASDQMHWFITCHHCDYEYFIDFEQDTNRGNHYVNHEKEIYACGKCGLELSDEDRRQGRWVARYKGRKRRGYWISQLMAPWVSAPRILEQFRESSPEFFNNFVLGKAYTPDDLLIDREAITAIISPGTTELFDVCMGVDNGIVKHYVIGTPKGIIKYGSTESWDEIENLFLTYGCKAMVIDANPYPTVPKRLVEKYKGKVFVNFYIADQRDIGVVRWMEKEKYGIVHSDRTKIIDHVVGEIHDHAFSIFLNQGEVEDLIYHCTSIYRTVETDTHGVPRAKWITKGGKPDHWAHAMVYWRIALLKTLGTGSAVVTPHLLEEKKGYIVEDDKLKDFHIDLEKLAKESDTPTRDWKHN